MAKGILGTTSFDDFVKQQLLDWKRIEKIAKQNGIYTAADLAKLIRNNSPIKSIGDSKMQWAKRIYREEIKNKKSMYQILKDDLEKLEILNGHNLNYSLGYRMGKSTAKEKNKISSWLKDYTQIIENNRKYSEFMKRYKKMFLEWYDVNKNDDGWDHFLDFMHKAFMNPGKSSLSKVKARLNKLFLPAS